MAEGILSGVVRSILDVLGSQFLQEIQLAYGAQDEIRQLKSTVRTINGVLVNAEKQFNNNEAATGWLESLKDVVYDADDLLDDFHTQLKLKDMANEVRIFCSQSNHIAYSHKMGRKIKAIRERLERIKSEGQLLRFSTDNGNGLICFNRQRETHSFECEENVIGRDDDRKAILERVLDSYDHAENNVSVISIVGIGGVGKTTLVQSIYNVEKVKTHFQLRMWVCVSDDFTLRTVVEKILKSATRNEIEKLEMDQLQECLREQINGKKYLLVLDDVWNDNLDKWLKLHTLLKNGAKGSKILVTTRMREVANIMTGLSLIYVLGGLTEDKSWSLFTKIAFEQGKEPKDSRLVAIGRDIVTKCVGVPLAIRTIGRLLYCNNKEEDWLSFRDDELSKIVQEECDILPILKISYDHLSSQLKQCFAYCALFPKDYEFEKENLIQLWMAEGFLGTSKQNQHLEDVGDEYFMDLLSRSFFQDLKEEERGQRTVMTCKMHDLMHDLAQSVIGSECKIVTSDVSNVDERSRHISFAPNLKSLKISTAMLKANHLRTILPFCSYSKLNKSHFNKISTNFRYLRTLKLSNLGIERVPTSIGKLKLLRYLDLSSNWGIKELPDSILKLINLQTLDLSECISLKKLPKDIRKMVSLLYLMVDGCDSLTCMPCGLGQLIGLRILPLFVVGKKDRKYSLRELNGLNKLKESLTITVLQSEKDVNLAEANLEEKQYLKSIRLEGDRNGAYDEIMVKGLKPHPNLKELSIFHLGSVLFSDHSVSSFTNLTQIQISYSRSCRSIMPLDQLPSLLSLTLNDLYSLEYISEADKVSNSSTFTLVASAATFFPSLKELTIINCSKLKGWWKKINDDDEDDQVTMIGKAQLLSFPCLSQLNINDCPMLTSMPLYPTLEELDLRRTSPKPLQQTMKMKMTTTARAAATSSISYSAILVPALSNLKSLNLEDINDLETPVKLLQRVTSLMRMHIYVPRLDFQVFQSISYLSFQEKLTIMGYDQLHLLDDHCQWQGLRSLRHLKFHLIENMVRLPKWIHHITSLQHLEIYKCINLMSLPEGMQLEKLEIENCPHLKERCGNKGAEWPKIAHIPNIQIDCQWIQLEGCYQVEDMGDEPEVLQPTR